MSHGPTQLDDSFGLTDAPLLAVGDIFLDRYLIDGRIGEGAFAIVYGAVDVWDNRRVAIKVLRPVLEHPLAATESLQREGEILGQLQSNWIVRLHDVLPKPHCALVLEWLSGPSLETYLSVRGPLDQGTATRVARQVLLGLGDLHRSGYLHLDLKPSNIVFADPEEKERAVITDLGSAQGLRARSFFAAWFGAEKSRSKVCVAYQSPEEIRGERVGRVTDIYKVGLLMLEMLEGYGAVKGRMRSGFPSLSLSRRFPGVAWNEDRRYPDRLEQVVRRALSFSVKARYQGTEQMLDALAD